MSKHRSYEETYQGERTANSESGEKTTQSSLDEKHGDHKQNQTHEGTQGKGDQLDIHQVIGSMDKKDKAEVHDTLLGDEQVKGGMDYIQ